MSKLQLVELKGVGPDEVSKVLDMADDPAKLYMMRDALQANAFMVVNPTTMTSLRYAVRPVFVKCGPDVRCEVCSPAH